MVNQRPELLLVSRPALTTGLFGPFQGWFFSLFKYLSCILALPSPHGCEENWLSPPTPCLFPNPFSRPLSPQQRVCSETTTWERYTCDRMCGLLVTLAVRRASFELVRQTQPWSFNCITVLWFNHPFPGGTSSQFSGRKNGPGSSPTRKLLHFHGSPLSWGSL